MSTWQQEYLEQIEGAHTQERVLQVLCQYTASLGFEHCAYGLQFPVGFGALETVMLNNYPDAWRVRYAEQNYLQIDPTVQHGLRSTAPIVWDDPLFHETRGFWEDARSFGLEHGWAQSSMSMSGTRGLLTLVRSNTPLSEQELAHQVCHLGWLVQITHERMTHLVSPRFIPAGTESLSQKEKEVLRWTAEGKTAWEASMIMDLSERTVNFHIARAMGKLDCVNKTSAAVRASLLGLLH